MKQGCPLSEAQVRKINYLLETTDMSMVDIATAIACTRSTVSRLNQQHNIRNYEEHRTSWQVKPPEDSAVAS